MADVVNPLNAVTANRQDSGNVVTPESPDANILSPTIKEAMDFILPKSATQLLQQGLSCDQPNHMQNLPETVSNMLPNSVASDAPYPSKTTGLITPASGKRSCDQQAESHFNNLNGSSNDSQKKINKIRISKADLEIITSASDIRMNDLSTETDSDPEDMTRCFKKRKHKKKKRSPKTSPERESSVLHNSVSEEDPSSVMGHRLVSELNVKSLTQPLSSRNNELQGTLSVTDSSFDSRLHSSGGDKDGSGLRDCQNSFGKTMPKNGFSGDCAIGAEDVSNISTSSSKENVLSQRKPSGQSLPRTKRMEYNIIRHKSKIKNTFLPCFVVLNKCADSFKVSNSHFDFSSNELPLSIRVKYLLEMCRKGKIDCKKRRLKGVFIVDKPVYKNIFEENILMGASDDEFENTRRSLRKRVKNISYVEPTEDDIMDDFKRKRSRSKAKESGSGHDTDTSQETKRKKTSNNSEEPCKNTESAASKLEQMTYTKVGKSANEIIVFPKIPIAKDIIKSHKANENVEDKLKSKIVSNRSNPPLPFDASTSSLRPLMAKSPVAPAPARVSVFSGFPRQRLYSPPAGPIFPINAPQFSTAVTALSAVPNISSITTLSNPMVSSSQPIPMQKHPPQYCVMKVDGKDVLLQLVPSGVGGSVLLQGNKTAPLLSPPLRSTPPISTQAIPVPVCAAQVPTVSSGLFPLLGLPLVNQSVSSTKNNIPLSGFPVISFASGSGFTTPLTARTTLTSATPLAHTSAPLKTTTSLVSVVPSTGMVTTSVIRTTNSTSAVSSILSTMGAPASKALRSFVADQIRPAVVRPDQVATLVAPGLRAVVPNQTSSLRSIRIFVPGCTNTGTPGRFATLGSIANSSPLTRLSASSDLLPQRKQSHDHELTPEQKAAKRRKLEKKYPLPPGVVIKTEPLESHPPPTVTTAVRSLLSPNIQLVSSVSRPGTTVRIIVPSAANSVASGVRGGQNIVYRASSGGSQTVLTTLGNLTSIVSSLHSPSAAIVSSVTTTATIASSSSTPQNLPKQTNSLEFSSPSSCAPTLTSQSPGIWSPASSLSDNSTKTSGTTSTLTSSVERLPAEKSLTKERLEELKMSLIKFREFVTKQETLGLKGERLDKLKDILLTKEMELEKMQKQLEADLNTSGAVSQSDLNCLEDVSQSELNCSAATSQEESNSSPDVLQSTLADSSQTGTNSPGDLSESVNTVINAENMAAANDHLGTEDEPFVID
ncbi:hypothetical protein BgiMline_014964 [Biomphalaria glabrata]|nr:serine-rich adhesin for platelets [Biomphalaria glabrata]